MASRVSREFTTVVRSERRTEGGKTLRTTSSKVRHFCLALYRSSTSSPPPSRHLFRRTGSPCQPAAAHKDRDLRRMLNYRTSRAHVDVICCNYRLNYLTAAPVRALRHKHARGDASPNIEASGLNEGIEIRSFAY